MDDSRFDATYFATGCGLPYERNAHWLGFFGGIADRIVREINPRTALDAGCAMGFLVEALRERGVEAYGVDISEYAISQVHPSVKPYCRLGSITEPFERRYDLNHLHRGVRAHAGGGGRAGDRQLCRAY